MNARRPRWALLGLIFAAGWLLRQLPNWLRLWQARHSAVLSSRRKPKTRWPWSLPPAPRARTATARNPSRKAVPRQQRSNRATQGPKRPGAQAASKLAKRLTA